MADTKTHPGDISTYRYASREFLEQRRKQLQAEIFNPHLTKAEILQNVVIPPSITTAAIAWSGWTGLGKLIEWVASTQRWAAPYMTIRKTIGFMADKESYEKALSNISKDMATWFGDYEPRTVKHVVNSIRFETKKLGHNTGHDALEELLNRLKPEAELERMLKPVNGNLDRKVLAANHAHNAPILEMLNANREVNRQEFFKVLKLVHSTSPESHVAQYHIIGDELRRLIAEGTKEQSAARLGEIAFHGLEYKIIGNGMRDNRDIINKFRVPTMAATIVVSGAIGLVRSFQNAYKQKTLDMESETSFIDRQLNKRDQAQEKQASLAAPTAPAPTPSSVISPSPAESARAATPASATIPAERKPHHTQRLASQRDDQPAQTIASIS